MWDQEVGDMPDGMEPPTEVPGVEGRALRPSGSAVPAAGPEPDPWPRQRWPGPSPVDALLADGRVVSLRPITPADLDEVVALHESVADESIRMRFFSLSRAAARTYAEHLCETPGTGPGAVISLAGRVSGRLVAVGSAEPDQGASAEVSFLVADEAHGMGIGTLLLEHLAAAARNRGIRRFTAEVLADNGPMLRVFTDCGFDLDRRPEQGVVTLSLDTAATDRAVAAADRREARAEARSLAPLLYPQRVAVVGVRRDGSGVGRAVLDELRDGGFTGEVVVVHPEGLEVPGATSCRDLSELDLPVDLLVVAVPAPGVLEVVRSAAEAGVRAAVVLSSGFAEAGPEGAHRQRELVALARAHSMRVVGPNCLGVMTADPATRLNATFTRGLPPTGGLAVASQSGGVGIALLDLARETGSGLASFVSLGNKADVSGNDLLAAWLDDDRVSAAALYLESFGNARKFARVARRFAERKPLLAVVGGRSTGGRRAGASHTAAAAAPAVGVDALFAQAGVIGCHGLAELADAARLLTTQPLPGGPRLGIVGNAGGLGVLAADAATADGLVVEELPLALQTVLSDLVPGAAGVANPVDLGAAAEPAALLGATRAMLASPALDAVLLVLAATRVTEADTVLAGLAAARVDHPDTPLLLVALGEIDAPPQSPAGGAPFRSVEDATRALAHAATYAAWRATPGGLPRSEDPAVARRARLLAREALAGATPDGWVDPRAATALLGCYGITGPPGRVVRSLDDAVRAARDVGFPVVLKAADPDVVHKSDRGLVRTSLGSPEEVRWSYVAIGDELGTPHPPVLVQAQLAAGIEVAVGVVRDPGFGPLVMVAAGGVATDVWDDRVFLMPPLTERDAARAVRSLRIWPLLAGYRGAAAVDVGALEDVVQAVGQLALDVPELAELDLNPVIMRSSGAACVDAKVRLVQVADGADDEGVPRRLRPGG